ncbi:unannotated protein [freshwater metagenome]|uniref:Unannotated protein n=1 Tax=freshwater metagenome TaxID=449393 RepID=A0A6J7D1I2_9ZZZZ|nr:SDR family NAD(P)-dependent oxidoreductase [Actinomycetota bacterium]
MPVNSESSLRFDGRVAVVTGGGRGIGRSHALALAERGAKVVVNDFGGALAGDGSDSGPAAEVVAEIIAAGGEAVANTASVTDPAGAVSMVDDAISNFGRIDIVINNAGNLDPCGMPDLTPESIAQHHDIHVLGSFNVTRAAWPHFTSQGYGRVVLTASVGFFGHPYLMAYSVAKGATVSLARSLAVSGEDQGIKVNLVAPAADTRMVTDPELRAKSGLPPRDSSAPLNPERGPERVSPMVVVLAHESCPVNGEMFAAGLGRFAKVFLAETPGVIDRGLDAEGVLARWDEIVDETGYIVQVSSAGAVEFRERLLTDTP